MKAKLHAHQREAVEKMHNGCVLWGDVGTGKTITALGYALEKESEREIVVVTTAKVRDSVAWEKEAGKLGLKAGSLEVTSWNKINELIDYEGKFFIFDEQRLVGAGAWVQAFYKIAKKNHWILLSATPGDTWSDYAPMFIANGWYKNITEFRREHAVYSRFTTFPKIERYINEGKLVKLRKMLLVEMPMARHTKRHMHYIKCEFDEETLDMVRKRRWNVYEDKPLQNAAELFGVMRKVVSSDPDRSTQMRKLMETNRRLIVFYNFNYELEALRKLCNEMSQRYATTSNESTLDENLSHQNSNGMIDPYPKDFESSLPPWELTDEEIALALQQWTASTNPDTEKSETWNPTEAPATSATPTRPPTREPRTPAATGSTTATLSRALSPTPSQTTSPSRTKSRHVDEQLARTDDSAPTRPDSRQTSDPASPTPASPTPPSPMPSRPDEPQPARTALEAVSPSHHRTPASAVSSTSSRTREATTIPASRATAEADSWVGTIWEEDWTPPAGTPDPRDQFKNRRAKYNFESRERRKVGWTENSPPSPTSTSYHESQKELYASSPSLDDTGSTRTSSDLTSPLTTPERFEGSFGWAEWNGHFHQEIPETDNWIYLVQYASGSEGWNCVETDAMAFWSLTYSWKQFWQAQGRIDRLNTEFTDLHYYVLMTDSPAEKPVIRSLEQKHDFQPR